jgi:hypothetical protein
MRPETGPFPGACAWKHMVVFAKIRGFCLRSGDGWVKTWHIGLGLMDCALPKILCVIIRHVCIISWLIGVIVQGCMAGQQPSASPRLYRRTFDDTRSRCTTDVWLSLTEHRQGRLWCWDTFVLPVTNDPRLVWTTYKSIHTGNSNRLTQEETMGLWKLSREAWMSTSVTDSPWRISADNRVFS